MQIVQSWRAVAAAGAILIALALPAKAVTTLTLNDGVTPITTAGADFGNSGLIAAFTDFFSFSLAGATNFSTTASATNSAGDITSFTIAVLSGQGLGGSVLFGSTTPTQVGNSLALSTSGILAPGTYSVRITGVGSAGGSSYGGSVDVAPVVPIPGALLLFGSGLIGLGALTRRKKKQSQPALA